MKKEKLNFWNYLILILICGFILIGIIAFCNFLIPDNKNDYSITPESMFIEKLTVKIPFVDTEDCYLELSIKEALQYIIDLEEYKYTSSETKPAEIIK